MRQQFSTRQGSCDLNGEAWQFATRAVTVMGLFVSSCQTRGKLFTERRKTECLNSSLFTYTNLRCLTRRCRTISLSFEHCCRHDRQHLRTPIARKMVNSSATNSAKRNSSRIYTYLMEGASRRPPAVPSK